MLDKKVLKYYLIALIFPAIIVVLSTIQSSDEWLNEQMLYNLPFVNTSGQATIFFYAMALIVPYLGIILGYALAAVIVKIFCRFTKFSKRIEFVGYARTDRSGNYLRKRYLIQFIFATLLCINIWVALVSSEKILSLLLSEAGKESMYDEDGRIFNFVLVAWYWLPAFISALLFAICAVIQDSGLVTIKRLSGQSEFADTERVGDRIFGLVKGYAGISVILNFYLLITTPLGKEGSLVLYPLVALLLMIHIIIAIDLLRNIGIKWIHKAVKSSYPPQLIELSFKKTDIDPKDLLI